MILNRLLWISWYLYFLWVILFMDRCVFHIRKNGIEWFKMENVLLITNQKSITDRKKKSVKMLSHIINKKIINNKKFIWIIENTINLKLFSKRNANALWSPILYVCRIYTFVSARIQIDLYAKVWCSKSDIIFAFRIKVTLVRL